MAKTFLFSLLVTVFLITAPPADAQQPMKIPRIGYVTASSRSTVPTRIEGFSGVCASLGT